MLPSEFCKQPGLSTKLLALVRDGRRQAGGVGGMLTQKTYWNQELITSWISLFISLFLLYNSAICDVTDLSKWEGIIIYSQLQKVGGEEGMRAPPVPLFC